MQKNSPQPIHSSVVSDALLFTRRSAPVGQCLTHLEHPIHTSGFGFGLNWACCICFPDLGAAPIPAFFIAPPKPAPI